MVELKSQPRFDGYKGWALNHYLYHQPAVYHLLLVSYSSCQCHKGGVRGRGKNTQALYILKEDWRHTGGQEIHSQNDKRTLVSVGFDLSYFTSTNSKSEEVQLLCLKRKQETNQKAVRLIEELILRSRSGRKSVIQVQDYILVVLVRGRKQEIEYLFGSVKIGKKVYPGLTQNIQALFGLKIQH